MKSKKYKLRDRSPNADGEWRKKRHPSISDPDYEFELASKPKIKSIANFPQKYQIPNSSEDDDHRKQRSRSTSKTRRRKHSPDDDRSRRHHHQRSSSKNHLERKRRSRSNSSGHDYRIRSRMQHRDIDDDMF